MAGLFDYTGKRVVLTGGATGIGEALATLLRELNVGHLTILDVKPAKNADLYIPVDLSDKHSIDEAIHGIEGGIDVVFSNAGVSAAAGLRTCMAGNGWPMQKAEIDALLDIADWDAFLDAAEQSEGAKADVYPFSKACMQVYTMRRSYDAIRQGIRINSVCPGTVNTPLMPAFRQTMGDKAIDWTVSVQGNGRMAVATDIAPPLAFLGSDAAAFMSGVNLLVDSGFTAAMVTGQADFSGLA
jgi:NAD(P)-dependent dehydrogenase (short-subunit alcohol dehydrogenase family)